MFIIIQVIASDADSGPNGDVSYTILPGKGSELFDINTKTGAITAKQKLTAGEAFDFPVSHTIIHNLYTIMLYPKSKL